ncbi:hypothetical protein NLG97_g665 [Lecanicillium saksenae]|uniref:Uncharacterized protein n=1 Tax=Lecanicillium saksenae TaxID=468837 RepID=A0ACC1R7N7_9HYPO|nr:hypothetical protein NLG97_g665 [Lecanicillium saksenae]
MAASIVERTTVPTDMEIDEDTTKVAHLHIATICLEAEPPNWDHMVAIKFFMENLLPTQPAHLPKIQLPNFNCWNHVPSAFICKMISEQLRWASASRGRILRPCDDPLFACTWAKYFHHYSEVLAVTNQCLQRKGGNEGHYRALHCMLTLSSEDIRTGGPLWQAHVNASFSYVQRLGSLRALFRFPPKYSAQALKQFKYLVLTSPARSLIRGLDVYSIDNLMDIVDRVHPFVIPVPTAVFRFIIYITQLRVQEQ